MIFAFSWATRFGCSQSPKVKKEMIAVAGLIHRFAEEVMTWLGVRMKRPELPLDELVTSIESDKALQLAFVRVA